MAILNFRLASHPMNWITIFLMLFIAAIFGHLLLSILDQEPASPTPTTLPAGYANSAA